MKLVDLTIRQLGPEGDGIHTGPKGRVYVERTIPGERIQAKILRDGGGVTRAEVIKITQSSPYRQRPPCEHYDFCGNCTLQHVEEAFYRKWKTELVKEAFLKFGLSPRQWLRPVFIGENARRRVTFTVVKIRNKVVMGYYRRRSSEVTDIHSCLIANPLLIKLREKIKPYLGSLLYEGEPVDIFLQLASKTVDMVITGSLGRNREPDARVREVLSKMTSVLSISRLSWRADEKSPAKVLFNKEPILVKFGPLQVSLPPAAFLQPTEEGEKVLVSAVLDLLPKTGKFLDLFSGVGTFSGPMLANGSVDAYESVPSAVTALAKAAKNYPLKAFRRDLFRNPLKKEELNKFDAIVFDPPRAGCREQAARMARARTKILIGVSCNPLSFAEDARILCDGGYRLESLKVVDQFLWSHHVETVGLFTKR